MTEKTPFDIWKDGYPQTGYRGETTININIKELPATYYYQRGPDEYHSEIPTLSLAFEIAIDDLKTGGVLGDNKPVKIVSAGAEYTLEDIREEGAR